MRAYTHQPFHVRKTSSANELDKLTTLFDGRATMRAEPREPRRGSTFPPQVPLGAPVFPIREHDAPPEVATVTVRKGPKVALQWEQTQVGKLPGMLRTPKDLCFIDDRNLAVAEEKNSRVQILSTRTGKSKACLDRSVAPGLGGPTAICMSNQGYHFLVADCSAVHYFNLRGEQEYVWPSDVRSRGDGEGSGGGRGAEFQKIRGMSADSFDNLVVADTCAKRGHIVGIYNQDTGQSIRQCKLKSGQDFGEPSYVACNKRIGLTYVSDSVKGCVYGFDKNGKHVFTFGNNGTEKGNGGLVCPLGMDISRYDNVYIADKGTNSVTVYSPLGGDLPVHQAITPEEGLRDPVAVSVGPRGQIAVAQETFDFGADSFSVKLFSKVKEGNAKKI